MRWPAAVLAGLLLLTPVHAQEEPARTLPFDGPEVFCHVLNEVGLKPVMSLNEQIDPKQTMVIVFGYRPQTKLAEVRQAVGSIDRFLARGGSLLIATDYRLPRMADLAASISGERIERNNEHAFGGHPECPFLTYNGPVGAHPLFQDLHRGIATNCPSRLVVDPFRRADPLLYFPFVEGDDRWLVYMAGSDKDAPPEGRALYIAGHGMFMNGMMLQAGADNFRFAVNAVQWLREGPDGTERTRALFIVDGELITNFDADLSPRLPPIPLPTVRKLDRLLRGIEEEGIIPRILAEHLDMDRTVALVLALATFVLLIYGAKKFMEGRALPEMNVPRAVGPQPSAVAATIMKARIADRLRGNELGQEARAAVLEWFREHAGVSPIHATFRVQASARQRTALARAIDLVLRTGQAQTPIRTTRVEFRSVIESLARLTQAFQQREIVLLIEGKEVRQ